MDKNAIKTFAVESRRKMIESVKFQASLIGITADEIKEPISKAEGMETYDYGAGQHTIYDEDIKKRESLVREINNKGFDNVVEEVAYTWFNRIIAIRYMEVNDYLPERTRVLSSETEGKLEPDIITEALDLDLDYSDDDREKILKFKMDNENNKLFQLLFIKQCNKLNEILPGLFEKTDDYMELLLDIKFTDEDSVVRQLVDTIPEEDFGEQVEIIGWLYQYYISEKKDYVINLNKGIIKKEDIPAATQLFTPNWVVRYMVDNSLGRYWIERNINSPLKEKLQFYFDEAQQDAETIRKLSAIRSKNVFIEELTFLDPCMGSGHILVYAFDVFFEIYKELGFNKKDIPELILKNNLYGLDIDDRAYQLTYFAVLMKARRYDRKILEKNIIPNVFAIHESLKINDKVIEFIRKQDVGMVEDVIYLKKIFASGKEFGSLIQVKKLDFQRIKTSIEHIISKSKITLFDMNIIEIIENDLLNLVNQAELLSREYSAVVTNPPYMNKFEKSLKDFARKFYKDYSKDLFSMFFYRNFIFCKDGCYIALISPFSWMFLKSYENLRKFLIDKKTISSLIQLEYNAFTEIAMVPAGIYVFKNKNLNKKYNGIYFKLSEFKGNMDVQKEKILKAMNKPVDYKFITNSTNFSSIPGSPISYYLPKNMFEVFKKSTPLKEIDTPIIGVASHNDSIFLKKWYEVNFNKISFNSDKNYQEPFKWFPYNKGGSFRKWYGNNEFIINFENDGEELKNFKKAQIKNKHKYFSEGMTWSRISSSNFSVRYHENGFIMGDAGPSAFAPKELLYYILGLLNSSIIQTILTSINPTLNYQVGNISEIPVIYIKDYTPINDLVLENIRLCKEDWNDYELSWEFKCHPFLLFGLNEIEQSFKQFKNLKENNFRKLKNNEIKLNEQYSRIYNVKIDKSIDDEFISINLADYMRDIKSFISFSIGCMFGRYSLDLEGLQFAGGEFNINNYSKFIPDDDNIIPVLDTEYFNDDIVGRFVEFVKVCFGEETLEENLDFIAGALKKKGKTSREIIRNYFLTDFFKDHAKTYKKCPIYWQFDSGRQNAFKCLIYMHRYEPGLVARVRTDYLHKTQKAIEQNLANCENIIANSSNKSEISKAKKDKTKYIKQLDEIKVYDEALAHIANQQIEIDLDDGVKINHAKFQNVEISKEGQKTKKINLLKKI